MAASHHFADHTGEVELRLQADSLPELFAEAGRAVAELLLDRVPPPPPEAPRAEVTLSAADPVTLLVDWLNELIFRTEVERTVFTEFALDITGGDGGVQLSGSMRGLREPTLTGQVKAATLHLCKVEPAGGGFHGNVVLDV